MNTKAVYHGSCLRTARAVSHKDNSMGSTGLPKHVCDKVVKRYRGGVYLKMPRSIVKTVIKKGKGHDTTYSLPKSGRQHLVREATQNPMATLKWNRRTISKILCTFHR